MSQCFKLKQTQIKFQDAV